MNRFKKYVRENCKTRLANDYPCLPFKLDNHKNVFLDDVIVDASTATITHIYTVGAVQSLLGRDGILRDIFIYKEDYNNAED